MTVISSLKLKNFKSFRKAEIPFSPGFTAVAGPNASGKCVTGETRVLLPGGSSVEIREIVEEKLRGDGPKQFLEDGVVSYNPGFKVLSLNPGTMKVEEREVSAVVKRTAPEKMLKITTRTGREVTTTDYHPLFSINENGLYALEAKDMEEKQFIAIPRYCGKSHNGTFFSELIGEVKADDNIYVPHKKVYSEIVRKHKEATNHTFKEMSEYLQVPAAALKGLMDGQAINLAHITKILTKMNFTAETIAELLPRVKGKTTGEEISMPWNNSPEFSRLLGYAFAEGSFSGKNVRFVSETPEIIEDISETCRKVFGKSPRVYKYKDKAFDIILHSHAAYKVFAKFGLGEGTNAKNKKIPALLFQHMNEREICAFLDGYLSGDGYVSGSAISSVTASRDLADGIESMYLRLGILPRRSKVRKKIKETGFAGSYHEVTISGSSNIRRFTEKIRLTSDFKMQRIKRFAAKRPHTNNDVIPNINNLIKEACIAESIRQDRKKNRNVKLGAYVRDACNPSRAGLQEVIAQEFGGTRSQKAMTLRVLAESDIFWDSIKKIEVVKPPRHVYDLCVAGSENFVANSIFVHNSNVLDSLLFAMGITSLKMLRASKLVDLVNHDAGDGYAKVELALKDDGGREVTVTRMIDRQGKSVYKVDDRRKTLNEVQELLLGMGVNPNGHNIVVQGDITRVIEMNSKQRREVIEEVAGLQEFQEKKDEALKKLGKVEQKVKDAQLVLNEREAYLQQLERERESALRFMALQEESRRSKATILSEEIRLLRHEMEKARRGMEGMKEEVGAKRAERDRLQEEERELEARVEEATRRLIEASEKTYSSFGKEVEQRKGALVLVRERLGAMKGAVEEKRGAKAGLEEDLRGYRGSLLGKREQLGKAEAALREADSKLGELLAAIGAKSPKHDEREGSVRKKEASYAAMVAGVSGLRDRLHEVMMQRHGLDRDVKAAEQAMKDLSIERESVAGRMAGKKVAEKRLRELEARGAREKLGAVEREIERAGSLLHAAKGRIEALEEVAKALSGAKSGCPVCEKPLEEGRKESLVAKRRGELGGLKEEAGRLEGEVGKLVSERKRLRAEEAELMGVVHALRSFQGLDEQATRLDERIAAHRETLSAGKRDALAREEAGLEARLKEAEKRAGEAGKALRGMREAAAGEGVTGLLAKLQEMNVARAGRQDSCTRLSAEIEALEARVAETEEEAGAMEREVSGASKSAEAMEAEAVAAEALVRSAEAELEKASMANRLLEEEKDRLTGKISAISAKRDELSSRIEAREKEMNELNLEQSRNDVRIVDLEEEFKDYSAVEPFKEFQLNELRKRIPGIEKEVEALGAINMKSLENFSAFKKEVDDVREKALKLDEERRAVVEMIDKIEVRKLSVFMECFSRVAAKFSELYYRFFEGEGQLDLSDKLNPLEGGLLIQAKYKEDTLKSIDAMSGGEKSLTALAFLFAIQSFHPAPFYIFDEVDAALDKDNSVKVGRMIKEQSAKSQFISISHNDSVINQADQIIGVALNKHRSSVVGLRLRRGNSSVAEESGSGDAAQDTAGQG